MTPEERAPVDAFISDPEAMRRGAKAYFDGLPDAVRHHCRHCCCARARLRRGSC